MKILILVALVAFAGLFQEGGCTITGWTAPNIVTADGGNGALTNTVDHGLTNGDVTGITITATSDHGSGVTGYTKDSQNPSDVVFAIANDGVVTITSGTVDYATTPVYTLEITATDADGDASATVTLSVNDQPAFVAQYGYTIADGAATGTTLATVAATDVVNGGSLTYSFTAGNTNTDFAVSSAGVITTANPMAASTLGGYSLELKAADASLSGTTTVWVVVTSCSGAAAGIVASVMTLMMAMTVALY